MSKNYNQNHRNPENNSGVQKPDKITVNILTDGVKDIELMKKWGEYLASGDDKEKVKSTQLRKFFGAVKRIQADFENNKQEIILLNPKLAYAVGRCNKKNRLRDFFELIEPLINDIKEDKRKFKNFVSIFEAIVAYHKAEGGE